MTTPPCLTIIDYGSQYTQLIARRLREAGFFSQIISYQDPLPEGTQGVILSGSPDSTNTGRSLPRWFKADFHLPVLGICYGMQLLVEHFGGRLAQGQKREYGKSTVSFQTPETTIDHQRLALGHAPHQVWMSHGDHVEDVGPGLLPWALSEDGIISAVLHRTKPILAFQFHPEVEHTPIGKDLLSFFASLCSLEPQWTPQNIKQTLIEKIQEEVSPSSRVLFAVSGGVDSSVACLLATLALGKERVEAVLVDHGFMRKDEVLNVTKALTEAGINLHVISCAPRFLKKLEGVEDGERKRKIIGGTFVEVFEEFAKTMQLTHLGQGTLYPDVIESAGHGEGSKVIKTHHNVGGLPDRLGLKLLEPLRDLFKDEVRVLGKSLGLPDPLLNRHPFPGPGLAIRLPGAITQQRLELLREADAIFTNSLLASGLYSKVWQAGVVLLPVRSVGVMGDQRTFEWTCVLRAVTAQDAMTASVADLPLSFLGSVADRIIRHVPGINRVLFDVTSKPPATIEWE